MAIEDKVLNALTGSNIKTIRVSAPQLADMIYVCFVSNSGGNPDSIANLLKGKFFTYTDIDSPDGKFHFHISYFQRGLTVHRSAWVKNYETQEVFEWKGYTLEPLRTAFRRRADAERVAHFMGKSETIGTDSFSENSMPVSKGGGAGKAVAVLVGMVVLIIVGYSFLNESGSSKKISSQKSSGYSENSDLADSYSYGNGGFENRSSVSLATSTPAPTENFSGYSYTGTDTGDYDEDMDDEDSDNDDDFDDEDSDRYILPDSDSVKLTKSDLAGLSSEELRIARNEIYARHGRRFKDTELQDYFDSQDWYYGSIEPDEFVDSKELSTLERRNAKFILKYEQG